MKGHWKTGMSLLAKMTHSPETMCRSDFVMASWLLPLALFGLLHAALSLAQAPIQIQWAETQMTATGAPPDQISAQVALMQRSSWLAVLASPLLLLLRWSAFSLILWLTAQLLLLELGYRQMHAAVAYSHLPLLARDAATCLVLYLRGSEHLKDAQSMKVALGLNLLLSSMPEPWDTLAGFINVFELWYIALLCLAVSRLTRTEWRSALMAVMPGWLIAVILQTTTASIAASFQGHS